LGKQISIAGLRVRFDKFSGRTGRHSIKEYDISRLSSDVGKPLEEAPFQQLLEIWMLATESGHSIDSMQCIPNSTTIPVAEIADKSKFDT